MYNARIGVDLGGTKIEAVCIDERNEIIARHRVPTPRAYEPSLDAIAALVTKLERDTGKRGTVGIGIPGAASQATGLIKNANSTWLIGKPFASDLEARLGRPIRLMNDANCFAISEAADGAGAGADVVFGAILGTGVGAGIVVNGRALEGPNLIAGEWGHNQLPWMTDDELPGPACYCGKLGCVEAFLAGPGFERDFARATGRSLPSPEIVASISADPAAAAAMARYHDRLARAFAMVINILDPDVIVLGGGMSNIGRLYANVPTIWREFLFACGAEGEEIR